MIRVLIIDDEPSDRQMVQYQLKKMRKNLEIVEASTLKEALARMASMDFDLITLDLKLPDGAGEEAFARIFVEADGTPIVVSTGRDEVMTDPDFGLRYMRLGAVDVLMKKAADGGALARSMHFAIERQDQHRGKASRADRQAMQEAERQRNELEKTVSRSSRSGEHAAFNAHNKVQMSQIDVATRTFHAVSEMRSDLSEMKGGLREMRGEVKHVVSDVDHLNKVVIKGNGESGLVTRMIKVETKLEPKYSFTKDGGPNKGLIAIITTLVTILGAVVAWVLKNPK